MICITQCPVSCMGKYDEFFSIGAPKVVLSIITYQCELQVTFLGRLFFIKVVSEFQGLYVGVKKVNTVNRSIGKQGVSIVFLVFIVIFYEVLYLFTLCIFHNSIFYTFLCLFGLSCKVVQEIFIYFYSIRF